MWIMEDMYEDEDKESNLKSVNVTIKANYPFVLEISGAMDIWSL